MKKEKQKEAVLKPLVLVLQMQMILIPSCVRIRTRFEIEQPARRNFLSQVISLNDPSDIKNSKLEKARRILSLKIFRKKKLVSSILISPFCIHYLLVQTKKIIFLIRMRAKTAMRMIVKLKLMTDRSRMKIELIR